MAVYADRVLETTTTTGTGTYALAGAVAGFRTFIAGAGNGAVVTYAVEDGTDWEVGEGTVTSGTPDTLSRTTILASSNSNAAVNWGAGDKRVFLTAAAARTVFNDKDNTLSGRTLIPDGSISNPSIAFSSAGDVGVYRSANNALAVSIGTSSSIPALVVSGQNNNTSGIEIAGHAGGFPDVISRGTDTNVDLGLFSKGTGSVLIGNAGGDNIVLRVRRDTVSGTAAGFFALDAYNNYTEFIQGNAFNPATSNSAYYITTGTTVEAGHFFQNYNGSAYYNIAYMGPANTITGAQNGLSLLSGNPGVAPEIRVFGNDANINLGLFAKGTGSIRLNGTATTVSSAGAISTTQAFVHSGSTAHTISTTGAVTVTGNILSSTRGFASAEFSAGSGAPGTINWNNGQNQTRTLTSSGSLTLSNPVNGATYKLRIVQGGSGSYTITWPTIKWAGGVAPTLSTAVGAEDIITLYYNGTSYYGQAATGFA